MSDLYNEGNSIILLLRPEGRLLPAAALRAEVKCNFIHRQLVTWYDQALHFMYWACDWHMQQLDIDTTAHTLIQGITSPWAGLHRCHVLWPHYAPQGRSGSVRQVWRSWRWAVAWVHHWSGTRCLCLPVCEHAAVMQLYTVRCMFCPQIWLSGSHISKLLGPVILHAALLLFKKHFVKFEKITFHIIETLI